ncbi:MAG: hypothetical protein ACTSQA_03305 [Candidatus Heimdallarchaeaceae archaeon]
MIKGYVDQSVIDTVLDALKKAHNGKEVLWIDMDGVVADFVPKATEEAEKLGITFQEFVDQFLYRDVEGFFRNLPLIPGAQEAIKKLEESGKFEIGFVSACSWGNISCFSDKRIWAEEKFPTFYKKMDLSYHKGHYMGHYLIDDRDKYGAKYFIGEHIKFGDENYPGWDAVLDYLL